MIPTHTELSLMVNLGEVSSSVLGALLTWQMFKSWAKWWEQGWKWGFRGDEVTPEELSGVLIEDVLQKGFQARLLAVGQGKQDVRAVQGVQQSWELCPFPGGVFLWRLLYYLAGLDAFVLSSQKQHPDDDMWGCSLVKEDAEIATKGEKKSVGKGIIWKKGASRCADASRYPAWEPASI